MDAPISADRLNEERAFIKRYTEGLANHKVEYPADYSTPLEDRPKKVQVLQTEIADPPELMEVDPTTSQDTSITITVKSLKPALAIPLTVQITDTISDLKGLIAKSSDSAPAIDTQRLLLKGKALTDTKLIKEYDIAEGSTIHLMLKPATSTTTTTTPPTSIAMPEPFNPNPNPNPTPTPASAAINPLSKTISPGPSHPSTSAHHHSRTRSWSNVPPPEPPSPTPPSLTITTSIDDPTRPSSSHEVTDADIDVPPKGPQAQVTSAAFHKTISDPEFWQRIHALCVAEFAFEEDGDQAWEGFLLSMKGRLSAGEAAKIRDVVGIRGMGGA